MHVMPGLGGLRGLPRLRGLLGLPGLLRLRPLRLREPAKLTGVPGRQLAGRLRAGMVHAQVGQKMTFLQYGS